MSLLLSTMFLILGLLGGKPIIDGFSIDKCCIALSSVSFVAVAVSAITLTDLGNKLRMLPISENALRKSFPLH